jgi:phage FluMu protein gp41
MFQTEFEFTLPRGFLDGEGNLHRTGMMRLARADDEIIPLKDPRVQTNPAYATVLILARVITRLGALDPIDARVIERLYASDLNYLYRLYCDVNGFSSVESCPSSEPILESGVPNLELAKRGD